MPRGKRESEKPKNRAEIERRSQARDERLAHILEYSATLEHLRNSD
jgi:hypothetical protein